MKIVIVSGGFDPIHSGHIEYFKSAKEYGDKLIVALNSDKWLEKKKGKFFMPFSERLSIVSSINYVDDITNAFLKVINNKKSIGRVINIGSNYEISIKDISKLIIQLTKSKSKLSFDKKRVRPKLSEVRRLKANATVAKKIIKWSPMIEGKRGLIEGLKKTIDWYSKNYDFKNKKETYLK